MRVSTESSKIKLFTQLLEEIDEEQTQDKETERALEALEGKLGQRSPDSHCDSIVDL